MSDSTRGRFLRQGVSRLLDRAGIIDRTRFDPVIDLAWPRILTGFALMSQQVADIAIVGIAVGPQAVTGLAFAYTYWLMAHQLSLGVAGGTISLVSQAVGADDPERASLAVKVSVLVAFALAVPLTVAFALFAPDLIALFDTTPRAVDYGGTYLRVFAPAVAFAFFNKIGSRTFAALDDTFTPMVIRAGGATVNIVLNALFIFGLGMGVVGAALGTVIALLLASLAFAWGLVRGRRWGSEPLPMAVPLGRPWVDRVLLGDLARVASPLVVRRFLSAAFRFPLLTIVSVYGPIVVAAFEIGRRIRNLMNSLRWGFLTASSSLVGRSLGAADRSEAKAMGSDLLRLSTACYVGLATLVVAFAPLVARLFVDEPVAAARAARFIRVGAVAAVGLGIDGSVTGVLRGGGDTSWTFYATLVGMYVVALPLAYASIATDLGIAALYAALVCETFVPAVILFRRYLAGIWLAYGSAET